MPGLLIPLIALLIVAFGVVAIYVSRETRAETKKTGKHPKGYYMRQGMGLGIAIGVAIGVAVGAFRIVTGTPLHWFIISGYVVVIIQTALAPKLMIPLAYDSGGVTTSTVTVPLVAALGLGLAETIPGRSPILDGFGLIAFASLFPIMAVMGYAQLVEWKARRLKRRNEQQIQL